MLSLSSKITQRGVLAHLVERNTGSVEVSGSSPLYSTKNYKSTDRGLPRLVRVNVKKRLLNNRQK